MSIFRKIAKNPDGTFGPTKKNKYYKPVAYHNKSSVNRKDKTKWFLQAQ